GFAQYYHPSAGSPPYFRADSEEAVRYLVKEKSPRVWLVTFGRDSTRVGANTLPPLQSLLASDYHLESSKGYVEQDPTYRRFKELLLRRPAYRYKLLVEMYVRN
ncbi:MAG: hypothetical protein M1358_19315, partial [Chloroflexi bacterium]|nr:hypothetical protein [Chloroflexota bacterium]